MKRARSDNAVNRFLDVEATVADNDEEDEEDEEDNDSESAGVPDYSVGLQLHFLGSFIDDESTIINPYMPSRQMAKTSDPSREGDWHDLVASLKERYASGSKLKTHHAEDNRRNELDPVIVSSIEKITAHNYPFWRVRCKVSEWCFLHRHVSDMYVLTSQAQQERWLIFYMRW
jgi:hypothetical protein